MGIAVLLLGKVGAELVSQSRDQTRSATQKISTRKLVWVALGLPTRHVVSRQRLVEVLPLEPCSGHAQAHNASGPSLCIWCLSHHLLGDRVGPWHGDGPFKGAY